ncbi:MAG: 16S rRNA (adenine(1518)-N(6)/adenine(1519)-N(6))-dimethyltransferase RsmA [Anaerovoracaceae bacterium]
MKLYSPNTIRDIKNKHAFKLSKSLGQNFLTDKHIIDKIIEESYIGEQDLVIEIGPGMGVLTAEAAQQARKVIAIEIDKGLLPILDYTLQDYDNIEVINQDILKTNLREVIDNAKREDPAIEGVKIIGNLPYYITTPIIMKILEEQVPVESITIMMQKEVADRISGKAGSKAYGALTVAVQYYCTVSKVAAVSKEVFVPVPKVDSTVLRLDLRTEKPVELLDEKLFFACIKAAFSQRRKTLLNCLTGFAGMDKDAVRDALLEVGIEPTRRGETLTIEEFANCANRMKRGKDINE